MKTARCISIMLTASTIASGFAAYAGEPTFEQIQSQFQGQKVQILGGTFTSGGATFISGWTYEVPDGAGIYRDAGYPKMFADATERGKKGTVLAVELANSELNTSKPGDLDAFGKPITAARTQDPYVKVIVKMDNDGAVIASKGYHRTLIGAQLLLLASSDSRNEKISAKLQQLIGTKVYKVGASKVLKDSVTPAQLQDSTQRQLAADVLVPNLTPFVLVDAKVLEDGNSVVLRIRLPDQSYRMMYGDLSNFDSAPAWENFFEKMDITVLDSFPKKLSARDRQAIAGGTVYKGMPETSFYLSWGYPKQTNNYGAGGQQLIYGDGSTYIYLRDHKIEDWQSLNGG